ncbi:MAG TPA: hypothetical protein VKB69_03330, partial [Micromonosporaceae bacterium]|nr:hypothetical protein [Micromonosporaceae bacterium]
MDSAGDGVAAAARRPGCVRFGSTGAGGLTVGAGGTGTASTVDATAAAGTGGAGTAGATGTAPLGTAAGAGASRSSAASQPDDTALVAAAS